MLFNLIPLGPLDGHYILGHLLPGKLSSIYLEYNRRYGHFVFLGLILLSMVSQAQPPVVIRQKSHESIVQRQWPHFTWLEKEGHARPVSKVFDRRNYREDHSCTPRFAIYLHSSQLRNP